VQIFDLNGMELSEGVFLNLNCVRKIELYDFFEGS
jgi:hypothetical protein